MEAAMATDNGSVERAGVDKKFFETKFFVDAGEVRIGEAVSHWAALNGFSRDR